MYRTIRSAATRSSRTSEASRTGSYAPPVASARYCHTLRSIAVAMRSEVTSLSYPSGPSSRRRFARPSRADTAHLIPRDPRPRRRAWSPSSQWSPIAAPGVGARAGLPQVRVPSPDHGDLALTAEADRSSALPGRPDRAVSGKEVDHEAGSLPRRPTRGPSTHTRIQGLGPLSSASKVSLNAGTAWLLASRPAPSGSDRPAPSCR